MRLTYSFLKNYLVYQNVSSMIIFEQYLIQNEMSLMTHFTVLLSIMVLPLVSAIVLLLMKREPMNKVSDILGEMSLQNELLLTLCKKHKTGKK